MGDEFVHNRWGDPFAIVEDEERICWYLGIQLLSLAVTTGLVVESDTSVMEHS